MGKITGEGTTGEKKIGHYIIVSELGRGGMGVVYKAHEESLNRLVALKVLGKHLSEDESFVARFKREAQSAAALNHPNIVQVYAIAEFDGEHCFAMEFVRGSSVQEIIRADGPMDPVKAARLVLQAASGLGAAHGKGIYHRDIKPANLMVDESGLLKIADFGLAMLAAGTTQLTATGMFMGTPGYLSPEQCLGESVDQRTDIYALGVTLYEMLTGVTPLKADSPLALLRQIIDVEPRDVGELRPEVPESLRAILRKMMAKKPADRYLDCATLMDDLQHWLELSGEKVSVPRPAYITPLSAGGSGSEATVIASIAKPKDNTVEIVSKNPATSSTKRNSMSALVIALVLMVVAGASYGTWKYVVDKPAQSLAISDEATLADHADLPLSEADDPFNEPENDAPQYASSNYPESGTDDWADQLVLETSSDESVDDGAADSTQETFTIDSGNNDEAGNQAAGFSPGNAELDRVAAEHLADTATLYASTATNSSVLQEEYLGSPANLSESTVSNRASPRPSVTTPVVGTGVALVSVGEILLADSAADYVRKTLSSHGIAVIDGMSIPGVADRLANGGGEIQSLIKPKARYLVYIRADFTGERELYYMGRPDIQLQSRLNLETHDLLSGQAMGEGVHASVGYTSLSVENKVQELLRPQFGPVAIRLTQ